MLVPQRIPAFFVVPDTSVDSNPLGAGVDDATMNLLKKMTLFSNKGRQPRRFTKEVQHPVFVDRREHEFWGGGIRGFRNRGNRGVPYSPLQNVIVHRATIVPETIIFRRVTGIGTGSLIFQSPAVVVEKGLVKACP